MAKQTGQITVLKNNTVTNVEFQVRFIFTRNSGERITRDTTEKGVIDFDIPNGDWNVSWFAVDGDQKVLPLRAGLQLKITSSTPATALADWIYGDNTHVADPILTQWTTVLDEMKAVRNQFRDETQQDGTGKFVMQSSVKTNSLKNKGSYITNNPSFQISAMQPGEFGLIRKSGASDYPDIPDPYIYVTTQLQYGETSLLQTFTPYGGHSSFGMRSKVDGGGYSDIFWMKHSRNTVVGNHGQLHDGTGTPKDLLAVGDFGFGANNVTLNNSGKNIFDQYAKTGFYRDQDASVYPISSILNIIYHGYDEKRMSGIIQSPINNLIWVFNDTTRTYSSVLTSANTVVDSNGNYKPASPVIQLHHDRVEYNEDFDKDNPPQLEHVETGVYRITNVREICKDGWTFNKPNNGKSQPYFMIKYEQLDATTLLVRVFERKFDKNTGEFGFGEPRDIGVDERWIDFHFEVDHERIAREEAQMQKEQEEFEEQERLRKEAEELAEKEAQEAWEAEMAKHEEELLAEMEAEHKEE